MQHVIAAVAAALSISPSVASRIVKENPLTLAEHDIPARVGAVGYATTCGSHLMLTDGGDRVICDLRISEGALDAIERERAL